MTACGGWWGIKIKVKAMFSFINIRLENKLILFLQWNGQIIEYIKASKCHAECEDLYLK